MKKELNEQEERLLSHASLDKLIKIKMEEELKAEFEKSNKPKEKRVYTDISKVPTELIFSKQSVFKMFNRINKTETYLNGLQAEAMLGMQTVQREKIKSGELDVFSTDSAYIKFEKVEIQTKKAVD